ncbi:hypothetical protein DY000_02055801 [Brassica cretica]|uniref:At3g05675-like ankyrin-like domain-containing protein n=1 Tax=Brassica cretica TaxID=69181 RepID=A0ABQ7AN29_BRACR|nr:hypothetical protein DY000_02055801 [Brassica cretica]
MILFRDSGQTLLILDDFYVSRRTDEFRVSRRTDDFRVSRRTDDFRHGCRSFDGKLVEEGIGRTILTLPLEDQQRILMSWLGSFLNGGDGCPNLQRAFEVWWRRSFVRPYSDRQGNGVSQTDSTSKE